MQRNSCRAGAGGLACAHGKLGQAGIRHARRKTGTRWCEGRGKQSMLAVEGGIGGQEGGVALWGAGDALWHFLVTGTVQREESHRPPKRARGLLTVYASNVMRLIMSWRPSHARLHRLQPPCPVAGLLRCLAAWSYRLAVRPCAFWCLGFGCNRCFECRV